MKKSLLLVLCLVTLLSFSQVPVSGDTISFQTTTVKVEFEEDDYVSHSLQVRLTNVPDLHEFNFKIKIGDEVSASFTANTSLEFDVNVINHSPDISLILTNGTDEFELASNTIETGVNIHMRHVYANWTSGQPPPPDQRGLGVGALIDANHLVNILPNEFTSVTDAKVVGEKILNLLLDERLDRNGDGNIEKVSDGFGMLEYVYGMRDHISNAGNSIDATEDITDLATSINNNLSGSIIDDGNFGTFKSNLNNSNADLAVIYQDALSLLDADLNNANTLLDDLDNLSNTRILPILSDNFNQFRNEVYGFTADITQNITIGDVEPTDTNDSSVYFLSVGLSFITLFIIRRRTTT